MALFERKEDKAVRALERIALALEVIVQQTWQIDLQTTSGSSQESEVIQTDDETQAIAEFVRELRRSRGAAEEEE